MQRFRFLKGPSVTDEFIRRRSDSTLCPSVGARGTGPELSFFLLALSCPGYRLPVKSTVWKHWPGLWDFTWTPWQKEAP